jgi:hypothetical protein
LFCADGTSSARRTISVLSLHKQALHGKKERRQYSTQPHAAGRNGWKRMASQCSRSLPGSIPLVGPALPGKASRLFASLCFHFSGQNWGKSSKGTIALGTWKRAWRFEGLLPARLSLRFLLSMLLISMKEEATDRFIRDTILLCNCTKWFVVLHHTMNDHLPVFSGNSIFRVPWPWSPFANHRRRASLSSFIISKQTLHLLIQYSCRGKEEV